MRKCLCLAAISGPKCPRHSCPLGLGKPALWPVGAFGGSGGGAGPMIAVWEPSGDRPDKGEMGLARLDAAVRILSLSLAADVEIVTARPSC